MEFMNPFIIYFEQHYGVTVSVLVICTLKLSHIHIVMHSIELKDRSSLLMDTTNDDSLLHAFKCHAK